MFDQLLNSPPLSNVRRNHALEHATINLLSRRKRYPFLGGYSDYRGFWIFGNVDSDDIKQAVDDALVALGHGERALAISPNCGTNFATAGILAGVTAWLATLSSGNGWRRKLERLPLVIFFVTLALMVARPLGPILQARLTTLADLGSLRVTGVNIFQRGGMKVHRFFTSTDS
jgi:hypothetical protein